MTSGLQIAGVEEEHQVLSYTHTDGAQVLQDTIAHMGGNDSVCPGLFSVVLAAMSCAQQLLSGRESYAAQDLCVAVSHAQTLCTIYRAHYSATVRS